MEALVNAVSEFLAAIFARFGYVGRARRRANIRDELALLETLRGSASFGNESLAARHLTDHIDREVARYSGIEIEGKRKIAWGTVATAAIFGFPAAFWTYMLNQDGFDWLSLLPGAVAVFMLIGGLGVLFSGDSEANENSD